MSDIGIAIVATNSYFVLGIRFIKKFIHHYKGDKKIRFFFFSDTNPFEYIQDEVDVVYIPEIHFNRVDGTNSKFKNIITL